MQKARPGCNLLFSLGSFLWCCVNFCIINANLWDLPVPPCCSKINDFLRVRIRTKGLVVPIMNTKTDIQYELDTKIIGYKHLSFILGKSNII